MGAVTSSNSLYPILTRRTPVYYTIYYTKYYTTLYTTILYNILYTILYTILFYTIYYTSKGIRLRPGIAAG